MDPKCPKLGVKMVPQEAMAYVDQLNEQVLKRWEERVTSGSFMTSLREGTLPLSAIRLFFRNWGIFTIEINTLIAASYHKHLSFFKRHPDLLAPMSAKVADEFIHPKPPGHALVMMQTGKALGLTEEEILRRPMLPEARAVLDFKRALLWDGTMAEWWFSTLTEEAVGHWAGVWYQALTTHYGCTKEQAIYFSKHHEADLKEHDEGIMGHGPFNRMVMQRILEDGYADVHEGYSLEYCALTTVDLYALMHRGVYEAATGRD